MRRCARRLSDSPWPLALALGRGVVRFRSVGNMPRVRQTGYAVLSLSRPHDDEQVRRSKQVLQARFGQWPTRARRDSGETDN